MNEDENKSTETYADDLEMEEILNDSSLLKSIEEARQDMKEGRYKIFDQERDTRDLKIINQISDELNSEMEDTLDYQVKY